MATLNPSPNPPRTVRVRVSFEEPREMSGFTEESFELSRKVSRSNQRPAAQQLIGLVLLMLGSGALDERPRTNPLDAVMDPEVCAAAERLQAKVDQDARIDQRIRGSKE